MVKTNRFSVQKKTMLSALSAFFFFFWTKEQRPLKRKERGHGCVVVVVVVLSNTKAQQRVEILQRARERDRIKNSGSLCSKMIP